MHEFSMTKRIVESILHEAKKHHAKKVVEVHLIIGRLTFLGIEQVRFSYEILVKNTILNDSKLCIEEKDGRVKCTKCEYEGRLTYENAPEYHIPAPTLRCPKCGGVARISNGRECMIKSLRLLI